MKKGRPLSIMKKLRFYFLWAKYDVLRAGGWVVDGFWMTLGDLLWLLPLYREAYYAYRQQCWQEARDYKPFHRWLYDGGWKAGWR